MGIPETIAGPHPLKASIHHHRARGKRGVNLSRLLCQIILVSGDDFVAGQTGVLWPLLKRPEILGRLTLSFLCNRSLLCVLDKPIRDGAIPSIHLCLDFGNHGVGIFALLTQDVSNFRMTQNRHSIRVRSIHIIYRLGSTGDL